MGTLQELMQYIIMVVFLIMFSVHLFYPDLLRDTLIYNSLNYCDIVIISLIFSNVRIKLFQFEQFDLCLFCI